MAGSQGGKVNPTSFGMWENVQDQGEQKPSPFGIKK